MIRDTFYITIGYIFGSILFAKVFSFMMNKPDIIKNSQDGNPGASNAFLIGGFWCGVLTLAADILKGFLPVFFYMRSEPGGALAIVLAVPVIGHIFSVFNHFKGGKGIATTFGCLLGLAPHIFPAAMLALIFIFFSVIIKISPNYYRTLITYLCAQAAIFFFEDNLYIRIGFSLIFICVVFRLLTSKEVKGRIKVGLLWMR